MGLLVLLLFALSSASPRLFVSSQAGARLEEIPVDTCHGAEDELIEVDSRVKLQEFDGVGGSFLRSGAWALSGLSASKQEEVLDLLFDNRTGAGLSVGKIPIGACDYCPLTDAVNDTEWWGYWEDPTVPFSLGPDLESPGGTIPYVRRAAQRLKGKPLWLQATMDYPPQWMLQGSLPQADVDPKFYQNLSQYYLDYSVHFEAAAGFPLRYLSLFNEPSDSYTQITLAQMAELLSEHVGPLFASSGPHLPGLTYGSPADRNSTFYRTPVVMNTSNVQQYTAVLFYHGYDCNPWLCSSSSSSSLNSTCPQLESSTQLIASLHAMYPHFKMWMSEVCYAQEYGNWQSPPCPSLPFSTFSSSLQWVRMVVADVKAGASAWIYWNIILNSRGGPHLTSPLHNDPKVDIQQPLVIIDDDDSYRLTGAYYALAHVGRFVDRSAHHIASQGAQPNLPHVAFLLDSSQQRVLYMANDVNHARSVRVLLDDGSSICFTLPAVSIATLIV